MELWFTEKHTQASGLTFKVDKVLVDKQTPYQRIFLFENQTHGKVLVLDGMVMLTERDEFCYHEMLVHPAVNVYGEPKKVLVIGGGDGGTVREILKYDFIEKIDVVEIDKDVVENCKEFLPSISNSFNNEKVTVINQDGLEFLATKENEYDIIFCDTSDPVGPAEVLYSRTFYERLKKALVKGGIVVTQAESPIYHKDIIRQLYSNIKDVFNNVTYYLAFVPTYCNGMWGFFFLSDEREFEKITLEEEKLPKNLKYYNKSVHLGANKLPNFVESIFTQTDMNYY